ncbi:MAG TPA: DUF2330 domain-containing protein, partial [Burkholderiales bacterium]|nr:DUF2330 domain-containing protein [Burkholderiales bacterium]
KTVISMANDYRGALTDFALVVPVPQVLERGQIHVGERKLFEHIDAHSAPRLAECYDADPCTRPKALGRMSDAIAPASLAMEARQKREHALGVTVEAAYTVGEYDIAILSAKQSDGLETWLVQNGYRIPKGAASALKPYVRQAMKFFAAKVNLKEKAKTGVAYLRPLQFAFESEKFMLPVRLGMLNARGPQDLILYVLTPNGRVEATNYRTVKLPANVELPTFVRGEFAATYKALFETQARREDYRVLFTEYFWDMSWCDPCAADPLSADELRQAGVFWLDATASGAGASNTRGGAAQPFMLTRLHLRYTPASLPEDLVFQETADRQNFQARYVLRHPWRGDPGACAEGPAYFEEVARRQEREAATLASLTGADIDAVRAKMALAPAAKSKWWDALWK